MWKNLSHVYDTYPYETQTKDMIIGHLSQFRPRQSFPEICHAGGGEGHGGEGLGGGGEGVGGVGGAGRQWVAVIQPLHRGHPSWEERREVSEKAR